MYCQPCLSGTTWSPGNEGELPSYIAPGKQGKCYPDLSHPTFSSQDRSLVRAKVQEADNVGLLLESLGLVFFPLKALSTIFIGKEEEISLSLPSLSSRRQLK